MHDRTDNWSDTFSEHVSEFEITEFAKIVSGSQISKNIIFYEYDHLRLECNAPKNYLCNPTQI